MDESFIPYSMIEPLLEEGMTFKALGDILAARFGISAWTHGAAFVEPNSIRGGVRIVKRDDPEFLKQRHFDIDQPVR